MSALTSWLVRRSHFPLALPGEKLGTVRAVDRKHALGLALLRFAGAVTVEPAPTENAALEKAIAKLQVRRQQPRNPWARARRPHPMDDAS